MLHGRSRVLCLCIVSGLLAVGCSEQEWNQTGSEGAERSAPPTTLAAVTQDLDTESPLVNETFEVPITEGPETTAQATTDTTKIFLWYADGNAPPSASSVCAGKTPPAFKCNYGTTLEDCQRKVQAYLDKWYADFNVTFTLTRPTSGIFYTVVVSSSGSWCGQSSGVGGVAPINCKDMEGNTCYAFTCGSNPKSCATIIAQEHAHMVGLSHTTSKTDAMYPSVQPNSDGFENADNSVTGSPSCRTTQNSYALMLANLGKWPGGPKPSPFDTAGTPTDPTGAAGAGGTAGAPGGASGGGSGGSTGGGKPTSGGGGAGGATTGGQPAPAGGSSGSNPPVTGGAGGETNTGGRAAGGQSSGGSSGTSGPSSNGTGGSASGPSSGPTGSGGTSSGGTGNNSDEPNGTELPAGPEHVVTGGCSVSRGDAGGGAGLLVPGLAAMMWVRSRRRRSRR